MTAIAIAPFKKPALIEEKEKGEEKIKRGRGRPRLPQLKKQVSFWADADLEALIKDTAWKEGKTVSRYCRDVMKEAVKKEMEQRETNSKPRYKSPL